MEKVGVLCFSTNELYQLDVGYGVAALEATGNEVLTFWVSEQQTDQTINEICVTNCSTYVLFITYGSSETLLQICRSIKARIGARIIVCGAVATKYYREIMTEISEIDIAILGEYEGTLKMIWEYQSDPKEYEKINGIAYRNAGRIQRTRDQKECPIENIQYPNRKEFSVSTGLYHIYASRGCEGRCTFCDRRANYIDPNHRARSISDVVKEIDLLVAQEGAKFISFSEPTFCSETNVAGRLKELYSVLKTKPYWIQFNISLRAEMINDQTAEILCQLRDLGLGNIFIGIESLNDQDMKLYGKKASVQEAKRCLFYLEQMEHNRKNTYYLRAEYGFINFNPYSTLATIEQNIDTLRQMQVKVTPYMLKSRLTVNHFSPLIHMLDRDGLLDHKYAELNTKNIMRYSIPYVFRDKQVEMLYILIQRMCDRLKITNPNGMEFIRNRYYHFYGYDHLVRKYDEIYMAWIDCVSSFLYDISKYLIKHIKMEAVETSLIEKEQEFLRLFHQFDQQLRQTHQRLLVQLKKIDELVIYRPVFR